LEEKEELIDRLKAGKTLEALKEVQQRRLEQDRQSSEESSHEKPKIVKASNLFKDLDTIQEAKSTGKDQNKENLEKQALSEGSSSKRALKQKEGGLGEIEAKEKPKSQRVVSPRVCLPYSFPFCPPLIGSKYSLRQILAKNSNLYLKKKNQGRGKPLAPPQLQQRQPRLRLRLQLRLRLRPRPQPTMK
jgi:hypothetical protein